MSHYPEAKYLSPQDIRARLYGQETMRCFFPRDEILQAKKNLARGIIRRVIEHQKKIIVS